MVSLMSILMVLAVSSLGISPIVSARFVISVSIPIPSVFAWEVAIVWVLILGTPLVWPVFSSVSVALVSMVDTFWRFVAVATPCFVGLGLVFRLPAF